MLMGNQKYLHMHKFLPIEVEIYAHSKTISINQRYAFPPALVGYPSQLGLMGHKVHSE